MKTYRVLVVVLFMSLVLVTSNTVYAHAGPHGNDECTVEVGETELRLSGYQFKGRHPDRHYCRHYPYLGRTIIKIDSLTSDLSQMGVELRLLKRHSWLGLIFGADDAFSVIKQQPVQFFARQVVSIESNIQSRDLYAIQLRLKAENGDITEQQFLFMVGFPFAQIMVAIAILLLLFIVFIFFRQWRSKRQQQ